MNGPANNLSIRIITVHIFLVKVNSKNKTIYYLHPISFQKRKNSWLIISCLFQWCGSFQPWVDVENTQRIKKTCEHLPPRATHPHRGAPGLRPRLGSTLWARAIFRAAGDHSTTLSPQGAGAVGATAPHGAGLPRPLLDAVQKSDQQDVARKLLHTRANQSPALGTSEFIPGTDDAQQAAFTERVLAR